MRILVLLSIIFWSCSGSKSESSPSPNSNKDKQSINTTKSMALSYIGCDCLPHDCFPDCCVFTFSDGKIKYSFNIQGGFYKTLGDFNFEQGVKYEIRFEENGGTWEPETKWNECENALCRSTIIYLKKTENEKENQKESNIHGKKITAMVKEVSCYEGDECTFVLEDDADNLHHFNWGLRYWELEDGTATGCHADFMKNYLNQESENWYQKCVGRTFEVEYDGDEIICMKEINK